MVHDTNFFIFIFKNLAAEDGVFIAYLTITIRPDKEAVSVQVYTVVFHERHGAMTIHYYWRYPT